MENNEELVTEVTENVEQPTEEVVTDNSSEKIYSEEDFNKKVDELLPKKLNRLEKKLRREYESKYNDYLDLENVIKAGTGIESDSTKNLTEQMTEFYKSRNIEIPNLERTYSDEDIKILANADIDEIISGGEEDIEYELNRLAKKGADNMSAREKLIFTRLNSESQRIKDSKELASIGVTDKVLENQEFKDFAKMCNPDMSLKEKYENYLKYRPKPEVEPIGSMKNTKTKESTVKDFYTREEAMQFTKSDFDKNPELFKAVEKSMYKW